MPQIGRLIGGAGTGKTTELLRTMTAAKERLGGDIMALGFASFTRAAREEAVDRASASWGVSSADLSKHGWFRTIHSTVFRLLGLAPGQLVRMESNTDLMWLSNVLGVSVQANVDEDTGRVTYSGDAMTSAALNCWELARATLSPLEILAKRLAMLDDNLPGADQVAKIVQKYEMAKRLEDRYDFSDTLLRFSGIRATADGYEDVPPQGDLPGVQAWLFDEQQDASPLLDAVCRRLVFTPSVKWAYVVGDPFQSIFGFAGSSASCFLGWEAQKERIMPKSYRCPRPILELGERCLRLMHKGYFDRKIEPADHDGSLQQANDGIDEMVARVRPDEDWLLIARTNYQVHRMIGALTKNGVPFRSAKATAGPPVRSIGLRALCELQAGQPVSGEAWGRALEILPSRGKDNVPLLKRGIKTHWKAKESEWDVVFPRDLPDVGATEELASRIASGRWKFLCDYGEQFVKAAEKYGLETAASPKIRLGTIHSVKGAEADNVALLTTTSQRIRDSMASPDQHDEECRIAYVGVTRARRNLVIVNDGPPYTPRMEIA
jgi:superfamily I DNA/RNA helicase